MSAITATAARYEIVKDEEQGWVVIARGYSGKEVDRVQAKNREEARSIMRDAKAAAADLAVEAPAAPLAVVTLEGEAATVEVTPTSAEPVKAPKAKKAKAVKEPKPVVAKGELTVVRKLAEGDRLNVRGVGLVKVVGRVKVGAQKFLVEYEDAQGEYGSTEMWANSRVRLAA